MNTETRSLIQSSWSKVVPIADTAAQIFYDRLFDIDPDLKTYFQATDMSSQRKKLIQALAMVVNSVNNIESILPQVEALGRRHVDYGVKDHHYDAVGAALIWTLEQGLAGEWNEQLRDAWTEAYGLVAGVMKAAAVAGENAGNDWQPVAEAV